MKMMNKFCALMLSVALCAGCLLYTSDAADDTASV